MKEIEFLHGAVTVVHNPLVKEDMALYIGTGNKLHCGRWYWYSVLFKFSRTIDEAFNECKKTALDHIYARINQY